MDILSRCQTGSPLRRSWSWRSVSGVHLTILAITDDDDLWIMLWTLVFSHLKNWLPPGYDTHVCSIDEGHEERDKTKATPVTWRVNVTRPRKGQRLLFKVIINWAWVFTCVCSDDKFGVRSFKYIVFVQADYKCQHCVNIRSKTADTRATSKNTGSTARMTVTLMSEMVEKRIHLFHLFVLYM